MRKFEVVRGPHSTDRFVQWAIQANNLSLAECELIRSILRNNWMDSDDYKACNPSSPFLQGYRPPYEGEGDTGWCLVEFWTSDREAIDTCVAHINAKFAEPNPFA